MSCLTLVFRTYNIYAKLGFKRRSTCFLFGMYFVEYTSNIYSRFVAQRHTIHKTKTRTTFKASFKETIKQTLVLNPITVFEEHNRNTCANLVLKTEEQDMFVVLQIAFLCVLLTKFFAFLKSIILHVCF